MSSLPSNGYGSDPRNDAAGYRRAPPPNTGALGPRDTGSSRNGGAPSQNRHHHHNSSNHIRSAAKKQIQQDRLIHNMRERAGYEEDPTHHTQDTNFSILSMLDVGHVSRETQLSIDLVVQINGFQGCTSVIASIYHAINGKWDLFAFAAPWGVYCLLTCLLSIKRVRLAERVLYWSMIVQLLEANISVMLGIAPEGYISQSLWAVIVSCLVNPTKSHILGAHLLALLGTLNYYLGLSTETMMSNDNAVNNTVNLVWRAGVSAWGYLILVSLMINGLKPLRNRLLFRRKVAAEKAMLEERRLQKEAAENAARIQSTAATNSVAEPPSVASASDVLPASSSKKKKGILGMFRGGASKTPAGAKKVAPSGYAK